MEQERPHKVKRLTMLGLGLTSLLILAFAAVVGFKSSDASTMSLNEWGDFLAGVSALLALLWLVIGYFQHGEELRLNTEALRAQQLELQHQVQETAQLVEAAKQQAIAAQQDLQHRQSVEAREAKPEFVIAGAITSAGRTETNIRNRGGEARNVALFRAYNRKAGKRRRVLNAREYNLLAFLLDETEPEDPFAEKPSKRISLADLVASPYVRSSYRSVTPRTFRRELIRLADLGFILFSFPDEADEPTIDLDLSAIGRY